MATRLQINSRSYSYKARGLNPVRWHIQSIMTDICATDETREIGKNILAEIDKLQESMHIREYHLKEKS